MTTLKDYLKSKGYKTRFLKGNQKDFYVYPVDEQHYNKMLELIKNLSIESFILYGSFTISLVGCGKVLIKYRYNK